RDGGEVIDIDRLIASVFDDLEPADEIAVEEHILSCSACAHIYHGLVRTGRSVAELVRHGSVSMPITAALAERVEREGLVSRRYRLTAGAIVPCAVGADDVYSLTTLEGDFSGAARIDLIRGVERI